MKLVLSIINRDDAGAVTQSLARQGFSSTEMPTVGGFLRGDNVTILTGVDEEKVQSVIDIVQANAHRQEKIVPAEGGEKSTQYGFYPDMPVEVVVGGATIFVVDIERFERI